MANTEEIKNLGRIRYIEPTNFFSQQEGTYSDAINFPYEDYNMAVDLSIEVADRYSCGLGKETGEVKKIVYSTDNGTLSFFGGTRGYSSTAKQDDSYLTANFTDISMVTPESNTSECLGIESIDITYNSWMYPQVVIRFVDVRGATVMLPSEKGYYSRNDIGMASSVYKSFFTFPYPIFTLRVKGFYGKGVTYKLAVEKTALDFDSNTGNFNITVTFIGYMFGIYADMPMTYLAIAPFIPEGRKYWNQKVESGVFRFKSSDGTDKCGMMTIPELRLKLAQAANNEEAISAAAEGERIMNNYDEQIARTRALVENFPMSGWLELEGVDYLYAVGTQSNDMDSLRTVISGYVESVSGYDGTYGTNYIDNCPDLVRIADGATAIESIMFVKDAEGNGFSFYDDSPLYGKSNKEKYERYVMPYSAVTSLINNGHEGLQNLYLFIAPITSGALSFKEYTDRIENKAHELEVRKKAMDEDYRNRKEAMIEKAIGFKPSVRNIYNLIFAHMDTFMHVFYSLMRTIKNELDGTTDRKKRAKSTYDIADGMSDTGREKARLNGADGSDDKSAYLPPFAAFYKEVSDRNRKTMVMQWPGERNRGSELVEVGFVEDLLSAAEMYGENEEDVSAIIESMSSSAAPTSSGNGGSPSPTVYNMIPLTTYDFIHKDDMGNPYDGVKSKIYGNEGGIDGEIIGIFATRANYYLCSNDDDSRREARSFGRLEAINLFKAVGDRYSDEFVKFIKKYADGANTNSETYDLIKILTATSGNNVTNVWASEQTPNLNRPLYADNGHGIEYCYHKGFEDSGATYRMFPVYFNDFHDLRHDYVNDTSLGENRNYISMDGVSAIYGSSGISETFVMYDNRDYIRNVFASMESEVRSAEEYLKENKGTYGNRREDEYGKIKRTNSTLRNYTNNIDESFSEKCYKRQIIVNDKENGTSPKTISRIVGRGTPEEQKKYYIKYPAIINEKRKVSLFDHIFYISQTSILAKAYLFLQAMPIMGNGDNGGIEDDASNGLGLKGRLLREGSYYWRQDSEDEVINFDTPQGIRYKIPAKTQTFMGRRRDENYSTFQLIKESDGDGWEYPEWKAPKDTTPSRRRVLKQYFIDWAQSSDDKGFAANEPRLRNPALYNNGTDRIQTEDSDAEQTDTYAKGLMIKDLAANEELQSTEAVEARKLQDFLRDVFFSVYTTIDLYSGLYDTDADMVGMSIDKTYMRNAFKGFMDELNAIYGRTVRDMEEDPDAYARNTSGLTMNPFKNTDLKLSTYITLKSLYDKWLCSPHKGPDTWTLRREGGRMAQSDAADSTINDYSDFDNFIYTDTFYHDIGDDLIVNVSKVSSWLSSCLPTSNMNTTEGIMSYTGRSVYDFLAQVAQDCGATLMALPSRFGLYDANGIKEMFTPISINNHWDEDTSSFIFMYSYKPSEHLGDSDTGNADMNGWCPEGDGINLTKEEIMGQMFSDGGYTIPAFGVTFAKQNQGIFTNISLNTENAGVTEAGLAATFNIAAKASESPRETVFYGQDLYRVYSQYSYQCGVDMMGDMQIMPLMYFQLNNIPLWKGAYMIKKVTHKITAGDIKTHFEGLRINKYAIPMADGAVLVTKDTGNRTGYGSIAGIDTTIGDDGIVYDATEHDYPGDPNYRISDRIDFDERNITDTKPIICLTPAHGPRTEKWREYRWSSAVVDRIAAILRDYKFKDGTPYGKNIQICNKNGKHTSSAGYSMTETKELIKKYGSKKVISVVPHWNGGAGDRHEIYLENAMEGTRQDSRRFAECMHTEMLKVKERAGEYTKMPDGMMNGNCSIKNLDNSNTDGAPKMDCACILTENWYADYPSGCKWDSEKAYSETENGIYKCGRGWMMDEEGLDVIAAAHARGIKRYIDTLA